MADTDNITVYLKIYLQRKTGTGAWTTIDSNTTTSRYAEQIGDSELDAGANEIVLTFTAATLNWAPEAQYRVLLEKDSSWNGAASTEGSQEVRIYSVSFA